MGKIVYQRGIGSMLLKAIMLTTAICLLTTFSLTTYLNVQEQKKQIINKTLLFSEVIAFDAAKPLIENNRQLLEKRLKLLQRTPSIKNVHIYIVDDISSPPIFFTSFNAKQTPPVPIKIDSINVLATYSVEGDYIEYITPILNTEKIIGYVYIRGSLESLNTFILKKLTIDFIFILLILTVVWVLITKLQKKITDPIENISALLQNIAKNRNYDTRAPLTNLKEIASLSHNLNTMLSRTQKQIERHEEDKQEIKQLNLNLEEKVNQRTIALKEANKELLMTLEKMHQYQTQIVENKKMASLGQMVAGVAHEVNTPIGLGITGSTLLRDKLYELQVAFHDKTLTAKQFEQFSNDGIANLDLIYSSLNKVAELISSFKKVAVINDEEIYTQIHLQQLINDTLLSMQQELRIKNPTISINCPREFIIESKKGPLQQIFHQLVLNSLMHGFIDNKNNEIQFDIVSQGKLVIITYTDNGQGVENAIKGKIFDPFVTSKRGQGASGLGMHLVYNLATQALGGRIILDTESDNRTRFVISLPNNIA